MGLTDRKPLTVDGVSTTVEPGVLRFQWFTTPGGRRLVQWDYRSRRTGELHSGVHNSVERAQFEAVRMARGEIWDRLEEVSP